MNITGKLFEITPSQQISDSFKKRTFVAEYAENPQYPEYVSFELIQDKCDLLDGFKEGEEVTIHFNLRGRKWTNREGVVKYFNSLQAWRLEKGHQMHEGTATSFTDAEDDLPF
ncbi:DUF3127 domain-containing protein [Candidatus Cardinium hertigii]|uniref:DUF3127 domain-containing protein n=1 Tax=Candidatus Cardinium hertigii TaxID=247481 RepID=A0A3N2QBU5_9BACT|nr:DUF3127 domain-containing protein [Candidatus Cardinium hertigii]ROT47286.1 DUF3127 domain-containing protein [Candidatus Cardinium hertigii]